MDMMKIRRVSVFLLRLWIGGALLTGMLVSGMELSRAQKERDTVRNLVESAPWAQAFEQAKLHFDTLLAGEFAANSMQTGPVQAVADFSGKIPFDTWEHTASLPKEEQAALDFLFNSPDFPVQLEQLRSSPGFLIATVFDGNGIVYFEYSDMPPVLPKPYVAWDMGNHYYLAFLTLNFYMGTGAQALPNGIWAAIFLLMLALFAAYLYLLFGRRRKTNAGTAE